MITGLSDIQELPNGSIELTFCVYPDCEDFMKITIDNRTIWELHDFCRTKLSLAAKNKSIKKKFLK